MNSPPREREHLAESPIRSYPKCRPDGELPNRYTDPVLFLQPIFAASLSLSSFALAPSAPALPTQATETEQAPRLGIELAAQGPGVQLRFSELQDLMLRRLGLTQNGQAALRQLIDVAVIQHLADERGVSVSKAQMNSRWQEIEKEIVASGEAGSLAEFLEQTGVERETFRQYLELALKQEILTRRALKLKPNADVDEEKQKLWIESEIETMGYRMLPHFWETGVVAEIGPLRITKEQFAQQLIQQTETRDIRQSCYEALLLKKIRQKMPDLSAEAEAAAIQTEIKHWRADFDANPRYKGIQFKDFIGTQGLNLDTVTQDPAIISKSLARYWVDRTCDDACQREVYQAEREFFDGLFGEGAQVFVISHTAGEVKNDLIKRTYAEAEEELKIIQKQIDSLETFKRLAAVTTDDVQARKSGGLLGWVRARTHGVAPPLRRAVMEAVQAKPGLLSGNTLGPIRLQGSVVLLCLGERALAPSWEVMAENVRKELRRRFMIEQLPTGTLQTYLDK